MMGLMARVSTRMNRGARTANIASDAMTNGCDQGRTFPPRFWLVSAVLAVYSMNRTYQAEDEERHGAR